MPNDVDVVAVPETVVVMTLVAVVEALQPFQLVQGALELQEPEVQPDQAALGHAVPFHQLVQPPECHDVMVDQPLGPQLLFPNGPAPGAKPPFGPLDSGQGAPDVTLKVASGDAVTGAPALAHRVAMAE